MKFVFFIALFFSFSSINAQIEDLIKNENITWIAEWDADYNIDDFAKANKTQNNNEIGIIKYLNRHKSVFENIDNKDFLTSCIWRAVKDSAMKVFSDSSLKTAIKNKGALYREKSRYWVNGEYDIDPITYETRTCIYPIKVSVEEVKMYRTHQIVYYDSLKSQFNLRVLSVAPLIESFNNTEILEPLFWFKPEMNEPIVSSDDIIWAQAVRTKKNDLDFSKARILKNTMIDTLVNHITQSFANRLDIPFYDDTLGLMSLEQRRALLNPIDSIDSMDNTDPLKIELKKVYYPKVIEINSLRMYQEWFWDERKRQLSICLKYTAPLIPMKNELGDILYNYPLFYRKN